MADEQLRANSIWDTTVYGLVSKGYHIDGPKMLPKEIKREEIAALFFLVFLNVQYQRSVGPAAMPIAYPRDLRGANFYE